MTKRTFVSKYVSDCAACGESIAVGSTVKGGKNAAGRWEITHEGCADEQPEPTTTLVDDAVKYPPTDEQQAIIDAFLTGADVVIEAAAGSGKTSTLRFLAHAAPDKRMFYVAFNKAIVEDVTATMPKNVTARTMHSLAYQAVGKHYRDRLNTPRQRRREIAAHLEIDSPLVFKQEDGAPPKVLAPERLAGIVLRALGRFCHTADPKPSVDHFEYVDAIEVKREADTPRSWTNNILLRGELLAPLERAWADVQKPDGWLRFNHDFYLKIWSLSEPLISGDVILFDEAQDSDPVVASIVAAQHAQRVYVGDPNQQIYEWRGAVDALAQIETDQRLRLTKSFRFGPAIADEANRQLAFLPTDMRVRGHEPIGSVVGAHADTDAILCRTNAESIRQMMDTLAEGRRPFLVGEGREMAAFARGVLDLKAGKTTDHPELCAFDSWRQVVEFAEHDEDGREFQQLVGIVEQFGARSILAALEGCVSEDTADVTISTAHRAKGREWDRVTLAGDFEPRPDSEIDESEYRLRYVAVTRAKTHLDCSALTAPQGGE